MLGARHVVSLLVTVYCVHHVAAVAVMSVDLGSEWMKVAVVSVGYYFLFCPRQDINVLWLTNEYDFSLVYPWKLPSIQNPRERRQLQSVLKMVRENLEVMQ